MDLGLKGKKAIVCAASKGPRQSLRDVDRARGRRCVHHRPHRVRPGGDRRRNPRGDRRQSDRGAGRHHHRRRPCRRARRLPESGHSGEQRRRPAARRFPRLEPRRLDQGGRRQHADADLPHQSRRRRHDRAQVRPHRQHHLGLRQIPHPRTGHEQRRPRRPDRFRRRPRPSDREAQRHHQQHPARPVPDRPFARRIPGSGARQQPAGRRTGAGDGRRAPTPAGSAIRRSSAMPARSCVRRRSASSSDTI